MLFSFPKHEHFKAELIQHTLRIPRSDKQLERRYHPNLHHTLFPIGFQRIPQHAPQFPIAHLSTEQGDL